LAAQRRKILDLDRSLVAALPGNCATCCFWETAGAGSPGACPAGEGKEDWVSRVLEGGFSPGKLIMNDNVSLGYIQFTPAGMVPRLSGMLYPVPSDDSIYITCVYVVPELRGRGLGRLLLDSVSRSLHRSRTRVLETHGLSQDRCAPPGPAGFFEAYGFREVKGHPEAPLLRLDLRSLVPLQESIQSLLERLPLPSLAGGVFPRTKA
jgi:ribosomal protein S18 acetylase RimI-like enzyme